MLLSLNNSQPTFVLQDPFIQFIVSNAISIFFGLVSVAGIILSIVFYLKSRSRKEITWERVSKLLVDVASPINRRAKPVRKASELILRIWNSGDVPILESDYLDPIKFNFGKGTKVLHAEILDTAPKSLIIRAEKAFKWNFKNALLEPLLLNSKDTIKFLVKLMGFTRANKITIENSGIVGVHEISEKRPLSEAHKGKLLIYSLLIILGSQVLGYGLQFLLQPGERFGLILGTFLFLVILFLKNTGASIFLFYALRLFAAARGYRYEVKTMRELIIFCVIASAVTTIPFVTLPLSLLSR